MACFFGLISWFGCDHLIAFVLIAPFILFAIPAGGAVARCMVWVNLSLPAASVAIREGREELVNAVYGTAGVPDQVRTCRSCRTGQGSNTLPVNACLTAGHAARPIAGSFRRRFQKMLFRREWKENPAGQP